MPLQDEIKNEQLIAEVCELAISRLVADCHVSFVDAAKMLIGAAAKDLTPQAIHDALKTYSPPSINSLIA